MNKPGISFDPNGTLKKRQNVGWCGTPPITYGNFSGTWKQLSEERIALEYAYWGGTLSEEWIIVELTKNSLKVKTIETEND